MGGNDKEQIFVRKIEDMHLTENGIEELKADQKSLVKIIGRVQEQF